MNYLQADFYTIDCLTNTLVGSGKANYGVIDQLVQRDAATDIPVIHASGLKGAIKEFCTHERLDDKDIYRVFGSVKPSATESKQQTSKDEDIMTGMYKFMDAHLLCIPVRSDRRAYLHITCPLVLENITNQLQLFGKSSLVNDISTVACMINDNDSREAYCFNEALNGAILEDFEFKTTHKSHELPELLKNLFGNEIAVTSNYIFKTLTNDLHLPVIARNHLENGESENLWYEQIVPRKSRFWFTLLKPQNEVIPNFDNKIVAPDSVIQIGANATVGYGYIKINPVNF